MLKISIIICAFNRSQSIGALLDCLLTQETNCAWEVIVVDNNSKDNTRAVVESFIPRFRGKLRYLFEPRQGKPYALNLGIGESQGEILAFIDDDCLVEKDYITQVNKVFQEYGEIDFMGGKIFPHWVGGDCPEWLIDVLLDQTGYELNNERYWKRIFFRGPLGILDYGEKPFPVDSTQKHYKGFLFYGPNMAIKRSALNKIGGYAPDRVITQDTEMCLRLIRAGMKGLYVPNVKVYHRINVARITPEFYSRWYFQRGKFLELNDIPPRKFYHPLGIQNGFILKTCILFLKSMTTKSIRDKVHYRSQMFFNLGQMAQTAGKNIL